MIVPLIILGIVQGVAEWLPVSSEGLTLLLSINVLHIGGSTDELIRMSLFLHLGTFFAALIYYWKEVKQLVVSLFPINNTLSNLIHFSQSSKSLSEQDRLSCFIIYTTLISSILGFIFFYILTTLQDYFVSSAVFVTVGIGILLILTGALQLFSTKKQGMRDIKDLTIKDSLIVGIAQGFAAFPGFSRSGLTVSAMLLSKIKETQALHLSFLLSMPIVLLGNILLNIGDLAYISTGMIAGLIASFVFGYLTIHILLWVARRVNFGLFVALFGLIMIVYALFE